MNPNTLNRFYKISVNGDNVLLPYSFDGSEYRDPYHELRLEMYQTQVGNPVSQDIGL